MNCGIDLAIFNEYFNSMFILNRALVNSLLSNYQSNKALWDLELKFFGLKLCFFLLNLLLNGTELRDIFIKEFDYFCDLFDMRGQPSNVNEI